MANATGWSELFDGRIITAVFTMFDAAFLGWTVAILFMVYQVMLYLKTRNVTICWVTGLFFASLYVASTEVVSSYLRIESVQIIFLILVFELAGILYMLIWK